MAKSTGGVPSIRNGLPLYPSPSAGILDSQSVKTGTWVNKEVGYDAGKNIKGRKRFTLVDSFGLLIAVSVMAASVSEREGVKILLQKVKEKSAPPCSPDSDFCRWWF